MDYYRCYIEVKMKDDGTLHSPDEILDIVEEVFEGSDVPRMTGKYFYDFISLKLTLAGENVLRKMPYFKGCEWSVLDDTYPLHRIYFVRQEGIRLHLTEKSIHEMPKELIAPYFERICDTTDVFFEHWFEPEGLPGECVIERAV